MKKTLNGFIFAFVLFSGVSLWAEGGSGGYPTPPPQNDTVKTNTDYFQKILIQNNAASLIPSKPSTVALTEVKGNLYIPQRRTHTNPQENNGMDCRFNPFFSYASGSEMGGFWYFSQVLCKIDTNSVSFKKSGEVVYDTSAECLNDPSRCMHRRSGEDLYDSSFECMGNPNYCDAIWEVNDGRSTAIYFLKAR
ncbi:MAG: hypothetical protein JNK65_07645 [Deltaproteobacteria bacterium]|nr:hypothetical protein [Deltaproteobacteria bacterium]